MFRFDAGQLSSCALLILLHTNSYDVALRNSLRRFMYTEWKHGFRNQSSRSLHVFTMHFVWKESLMTGAERCVLTSDSRICQNIPAARSVFLAKSTLVSREWHDNICAIHFFASFSKALMMAFYSQKLLRQTPVWINIFTANKPEMKSVRVIVKRVNENAGVSLMNELWTLFRAVTSWRT